MQREVRREHRTQAEVEREARSERLNCLVAQLDTEIDAMTGLADGEHRAADLRELEARLRRLADRAQLAGSTSTGRS